jgi:hypothetical protein
VNPAADQPVGRPALRAKPAGQRRHSAARVERERSRHINLAARRRELSAPTFAAAFNSNKPRRRQNSRASSYRIAQTSTLAVPAASEAATAMETTEAATDMPETSDMGDTHAVGETATPKMRDIYAAVSETVTSEMGDTYAAETHAVMDDAPISADAHVSEAVTMIKTATSKMGGTYAAVYVTYAVAEAMVKFVLPRVATIVQPVGIAVIAEIIRACRSTPVSWVVDGTGRTSSKFYVISWGGILGGGRL